MSITLITILISAGALLLGVGIGYYLRFIIALGKRRSIEIDIKQMMVGAKEEAQKITDEAKKVSEEKLAELKEEEKKKEQGFKETEKRLIKKDEFLDARQVEIDKEVENIKTKVEEIKRIQEKVLNTEAEKRAELEKVAQLSETEAKEELLREIEKKYEEDLMVRIQKLENGNQEKLENRAKDILATSIQRLAASTASELMTTVVTISNNEIKGKIIGKEGRNIRAFERASGVELIVDDTPGSIIISSFDPIRRQIARLALENLILDGRIQPAKIEELVEKAKEEINKIIKEKGEQAVYECGIFNFDPRIVAIIGRLYFRTSYGQNVLQHSIEMAHIAGMIAEELGADVAIAKAGALVHDIGKALTHEVEGTHVEIGMRILQKFGADERIITAMKSHHEEYPYETIESIIVQTADAISGGRPGARRDSVENYLKRLQELEALVNAFPGIEKSYALQAGREIRIFVTPEKISDAEAKIMARDIALKIEQELKYPGEIKVTMIRETRVIEYAR
ncbi:ribonuclease Y [Candidatus Nomurabacteria bacterium RIFCSPLOWO2_02_40_28]|uniref:Ribonuclease Y n=2 Tax=Candidatus Nomuraibacteriota TaxID=1752729 RepID=A0A837HWH2_9BACT|nr:MAG: Ribonuclease Y [Candidatus Nomurabacteria bacterium GW2011_GWD2_39_12]KKR20704.1 MAG: Ribonuclease Y [Candidatus Nomurabacteria bacterium GW2011_GWC2_39_41]KKR37368.1 MAG: Ribonuclease Y [Candidatus Nomurabacteria bacterium GW2011_GWE2_40_10]KKR38615.1 MAG: Ribonuclease Y [Candidatus Nomurabacteria bacterium GW2011_GWB1_40_11]KKR40340.1 MAG: Ribonuclease Y [Parcubacteria group bacterium GW2011_GWC1_40_11]KKR59551.1 MAG: Ribonuclease Y [Candidatus Nomurabacteria bacterium GW2011_GWF2_40